MMRSAARRAFVTTALTAGGEANSVVNLSTGKPRRALLALNDGPDHGLLKHLYGVDGYVAVDPSTYAEVEKVAEEYDFVKPETARDAP